MNINPKDAIGRLRALNEYNSAYEIACKFMGLDRIGVEGRCEFRNALIELLEDVYPDNWNDETLHEWGLVRLPRDKDGKVINVGDVVWSVESGEQMMVTQILNGGSEGTAIRAIEHDYSIVYAPRDVTHRPPVTVESVLREFADAVLQDLAKATRENGMSYSEWIGSSNDAITEYAKRLQLAEVDE